MGSCAAPSAKGDDKFITTDYLQQCLPEMQKSLDSRVYFDQNGVLCQRLGIDQVPARVSAVPGDRFLKVEFIPAEEGRK